MATYTDNYNLIKPTYAEVADIVPLNNNFEKIDEVMHSSQISLAPAYDQTKEYAAGDTVMYELLMYKCTAPTTGVWDPSKWERTTASESGGGGSAELDILGEASGAVASFADGASAGLAKCIAEIVPKQAGTGTPSPDNVRAISGYTSVKVDVAGKNLCLPINNATWNGVTTSTSNGVTAVSGTATSNGGRNTLASNDFILSAGTYTLSHNGTGTWGNELVLTRKSDSARLAELSANNSNVTFTIESQEECHIGINVINGTSYSGTARPQIEIGSESSAFEPYNGNIYTTPLGQTVYGGQLNVLTGELTIDRATVDLGSFNWISETATVSGLARVGVEETRPLGAVYNQTPICSNYEGVAPKGYSAFNNGEIGFSNNEANPMIRVRDQNFASMTDVQIKSAMNGVQMCYYLATPQIVQLTPQEVNSLLGQNNISADTGDVDIVYVKASAPIQPNPTGTPTATLKKLGIEGTVFEVPSGGGGSSSESIITGQERVVGTYNNKPLYQLDIQADDITGNVNITQAPTSIGRLVSYKGCAYDRTNDQYVVLPIYATSSYYMRLYIYGGYIYMEMPTSIRIDVSISLRYTKITD